MARVLLADDSKEVLVMVSSWLRLQDQHTVDTAADGQEAIEFVKSYVYDILVLDWEMPKISGIEVCRQSKLKSPVTPVIMLTGRDTLDDRVDGLDAGADDYLTKPFSAEELSARIRALLRRVEIKSDDSISTAGVKLSAVARSVTANDKAISLSPTEFDLLEFFMRNAGKPFSPEALMARVWADSQDASIGTVRTTINRLRGKLTEALGTCPLVTERGSGYKWTDNA